MLVPSGFTFSFPLKRKQAHSDILGGKKWKKITISSLSVQRWSQQIHFCCTASSFTSSAANNNIDFPFAGSAELWGLCWAGLGLGSGWVGFCLFTYTCLLIFLRPAPTRWFFSPLEKKARGWAEKHDASWGFHLPLVQWNHHSHSTGQSHVAEQTRVG